MKRAPRSYLEFLINRTSIARRDLKIANATELKSRRAHGCAYDQYIYNVYEAQARLHCWIDALAEYRGWQNLQRSK